MTERKGELMKFIHTADWHLGKLFYGNYLTEEQEWLLDEEKALCKKAISEYKKIRPP